MKIHVKEPPLTIRLQIVKQGFKTEFITLDDTTLTEVVKMVKVVIMKQNISPFETGKVTQVRCREALGAKNLKCVSVSFRGINPDKALLLIKNHVLKLNNS